MKIWFCCGIVRGRRKLEAVSAWGLEKQEEGCTGGSAVLRVAGGYNHLQCLQCCRLGNDSDMWNKQETGEIWRPVIFYSLDMHVHTCTQRSTPCFTVIYMYLQLLCSRQEKMGIHTLHNWKINKGLQTVFDFRWLNLQWCKSDMYSVETILHILNLNLFQGWWYVVWYFLVTGQQQWAPSQLASMRENNLYSYNHSVSGFSTVFNQLHEIFNASL